MPQGAVLGGYGARSSELVGHTTRFGSGSGELGFLKGYLTSVGANKGVGARSPIENWRLLLANPGFRRLFSSESPNGKSKLRIKKDWIFERLVVRFCSGGDDFSCWI